MIVKSFIATAAFFIIAHIVATSALKGGFEHAHLYNYEAQVSVEVDNYVSEFTIKGLLKIQRDVEHNRYLLSLSDLRQISDLGNEYSRESNGSMKIDKRVLEVPFFAVYNGIGLTEAIIFPTNGPAWSNKIKESIVNLLQFNDSIVQQNLSVNEVPINNTVFEERTAHGFCMVDYKMEPGQHKNDPSRILRRSYSFKSCKNFVENVNGYWTDDERTTKMIQDTHKWEDTLIDYEYYFHSNRKAPKTISGYEFYSYRDNTDDVVFIRDNRPLIVKVRFYLHHNRTDPDAQIPQSFESIAEESDDEEMSTKSSVDKIIDLLMEAQNYMGKDHLEMVERGTEHRQLFNKILSLLKRFSHFSTLDSKLTENPEFENMRIIFMQVLPYVGTDYSFEFIQNIILSKAISDDLAINLLTVLPNYAEPEVAILERYRLNFFENSDMDEWQPLSPKVYESAVTSFSHLLNRIDVEKDMKRYIPIILQAFKDANTTASKLVYLAAIGNIRCPLAVSEYSLPILSSILTERAGKAINQDRLRLAAINILSQLITDANVDILEKLKSILINTSESRSVRLAAYDVVLAKRYYAIEVLAQFGKILFEDKDLYNYHLSTIEALEHVGILNKYVKSRLNPLEDQVSLSLSKTFILKADVVMKSEMFKSILKFKSTPQTYMKISFAYEDQTRNPKWQVPAIVKLEILERNDENFTVNEAFYIHTNFNGVLTSKEVFFDCWMAFYKNLRVHYFDNVEYKNLPDILELSDIILKKIHRNLNFMYKDLTTFSVRTGFGIDAVFEHKYPNLLSTFLDYNWKSVDNSVEAKIDFSLENWSNGYSGVSVSNPFTGLTHSIRKTQQLDSKASISFIVKYDFSKNQLNFTIPIYMNESDTKISGLAVYSSTAVGITDANDEITCQNCGFKTTTDHTLRGSSLHFRRQDYLGMLFSHMPYRCNSEPRISIESFMSKSDDRSVVDTCGWIGMIRPNTSKPFSQLELLFNFDAEYLRNWDEPWYFIPGHKLDFNFLIGIRQTVLNEFNHLLMFDFKTSSTQGHFLNLLQMRFVRREDENTNFILCFDGKVDFPEISENHLPVGVTTSKLNAFSRVVLGKSKGICCSEVDAPVDFSLTGYVSEKQTEMLENYASNSQCAKQKSSPLYHYPRAFYPLTEDCVREMIANTTLRRYRLDLTSEKFSQLSLLQALLIIRSTQDKVKEIAVNSHNANVEVDMISPISEFRANKKMTFQVDYPVTANYKNLPNIYFSQDFLLNFIDKQINVINIYPSLMVFNNEEKAFPSSNGWNEISTGVDKTPYKLFAKVLSDKKRLSLKVLYKNEEVILKPHLVSVGSIDWSGPFYTPGVYYNQEVFSDFSERLHLSSSREILFSLSRVDDFLVLRSTDIPITVYYTLSSITIFQDK